LVIPIDYPDRRPPAGDWLAGAAAVAVLSFDVDAEAPILAEGAHHAEDLSTMSHQAYGPRVGVPRILELLAAYGIRATFCVPGVTAERWPGTVESILEGGHEVALHGHTHEVLTSMTPEEQSRDLEAAFEALSRLGVEPSGYRAPLWRVTRATLEMLPSYGVRYDSSMMDDDKPYRLETAAGTLAELPVHWSLDDWEQYAFLPDPEIGQIIETPSKAVELWTAELDAMRETNSLCVLTCHPFLSGRPSRVRAIREFVEFALGRGDVRFTRADELADLVLGGADGEVRVAT
jgi:peptidoglycan/xylan/chitin deacetylase (PgdA/CDA1 family)